ncbi:MAG: YceI family protein [Bacteroidota bacterium]
MKQFTIYFILILFTGPFSKAQSFNIEHLYPIELSHSYLQFEVTYMGYAKVKGNFGKFYGSVYYNPEAPNQTSVSFQVDVESIDTNNDWRDKDLQSGNWFLAEEFPHIRFSSTSVEKQGEGFIVTGDLSIKETTKEISFPIAPPMGVLQDIRKDDQVIFVGEYTLNRKEYGVMGKNWSQVKEGIAALSDEVTIEFSLLGKQINESNFANFLRNTEAPHGSIYAAYKAGGLAQALAIYDSLSTQTALDARPLNLVAYMLMIQNKLVDAQALMERNLQDHPDNANLYNSLGGLHARMGDLGQAKTYYTQALERDSTNMNAVEVLKHLR